MNQNRTSEKSAGPSGERKGELKNVELCSYRIIYSGNLPRKSVAKNADKYLRGAAAWVGAFLLNGGNPQSIRRRVSLGALRRVL
jgi:hypothetical protein